MSKSLKLMTVAFCTLFMVGQANAGSQADRITPGKPMSSADNNLRYNSQVLPYLPSDIKGVWGDGTYCDINGNKPDIRLVNGGRCQKYHSNSENSHWIIRYSRDDGTRIFKVRKSQLILWVAFEPQNVHVTTFTHPEATKRFVGTTPTNDNEVAQAPQHGRENCAGKNFFEKAACELKNAGVENAVGTIINKSR